MAPYSSAPSRSTRRGLSLGGQVSIDAPVIEETPARGDASERRSLRWDDWADVTPAAVEDQEVPETRLRPDALQFMVAVGVAGVVGAQAALQVIAGPTNRSGMVMVLLQASGPVTVALLTVFLLHACAHLRGGPAARFWIIAVAASALTYVAWSAVYFVAGGGWRTGAAAAGETFALDLLTGSAHFHLGLVLVGVQFCAVMPVVRWLTRATRGAHLRVLAVSAILQLVVSAILHWVWPVPHADRLLLSYVLVVVAGALFVDHQSPVLDWLRRHPALVATGVMGALVVALGGYGVDLALRTPPGRAVQTVAPAVTIAAAAALVALAAAGAAWEQRVHPWWQRRLLSAWSDAVSGVYLASPLLVQVGVALLSLGGRPGRSAQTPVAVTVVLGVGFGLPVLFAASWMLTAALRQSPLSIPLTARRRLSPARRGGHAENIWNAGAGVAGLVILLAVAVVLPPFQPAPNAAGHKVAASPRQTTTTTVSPVAPGTTATMHTISVRGVRRRYEVIVPQRPAAGKLPVIVFLHGGGAGLTSEQSRDGLLSLASAGQVNLVYPVGFDESWNDGTCCSAAHRHGVDDVAFLTDVVHASAKMQNANPALVYLAGYAEGGKMVYDLVCHRPRSVGGAVVIASAQPRTCPSGAPVPLLQATGDNVGGNSYQRLVQQVHGWVRRDRCTAPATADVYNSLTLQRWSTCADGSRVELATYADEGNSPFGGGGTPTLARVMISFVTRAPFTG